MRVARPITLVVCDEHLMCLESLSAAFDEDPAVAIVATTTERHELAGILDQRRPDVCLVDVTAADDACAAVLADLARRAPRTAVVALVDDPPGPFVRRTIGAGVRGFARRDATLMSLRRTIDRVAAGYPILGAEVIRHGPPGASPLHTRTMAASALEQLTEREREVLSLLMEGKDTRRIAAVLHISRSTARTHVQNVRRKLGVRTKLQAVAVALGTTTGLEPALPAMTGRG